MVHYYLQLDPKLSAAFDESLVDVAARELGSEVAELWEAAKQAAQREANHS